MNESIKEIVFMGTGTSEGIPRVSCLTNNSNCKVCNDAIRPNSKNRRLNTSILLKIVSQNSQKNILIDAGKFFYQSAINLFPKHNVNTIDAVILTHAHQDATGGFDDLRDWTNNTQSNIPIYLRQIDLDVIKKTFYYLVDTTKITSGGTVAKLDFRTIDVESINILGQNFIPLNVNHGENYFANGYRIDNFSYISDCSYIPKDTMNQIKGSEIIVLDALRKGKKHKSHLTLEESIEIILELKPKLAYFTDACHDIDHNETNEFLKVISKKSNIKMQMAFDGLSIKI
ncbi:MAG: MBL fold metallo-hydrolase [Chloroflexota bacterium]|nr:MBL fold metallo-hydrolase [Chloroflexota bacterium]